MTPLLPRSATIACAALCITGVIFAAITENLIVSPVRTAVAFLSILLGTVALASLAPVFDLRSSRIAPPATSAPATVPPPMTPVGGSMHALLDQLYPVDADEPQPEPTAGLRLVDADTGELVGDRVARLEERMTDLDRRVVDLGDVVADQVELTTRALGQLRREVERIGHVFAPDEMEGPDAAA